MVLIACCRHQVLDDIALDKVVSRFGLVRMGLKFEILDFFREDFLC